MTRRQLLPGQLESYLNTVHEFWANGSREFVVIGINQSERQTQTFVPNQTHVDPLDLIAILSRIITRIEECIQPEPSDLESDFENDLSEDDAGHWLARLS